MIGPQLMTDVIVNWAPGLTGFGETVVVHVVIPTGPLTPLDEAAFELVALDATLTHLRLLPDLVHLYFKPFVD